MMRKDFRGGFTLVELMVVILVAAILVAIALPSYDAMITKSRRVEAKDMLWAAANRQQQYFTKNNSYTTSAAELNVSTTSRNGYYALTIAAGTTGNIATSYLMSAAPVSGTTQASDTACATFRLNSLGQQTVSGTQTAPPCW